MARIIDAPEPLDDMHKKVQKFAQLKNFAEYISKQRDELKTELSEWVRTTGFVDDKGSRWIEFDTPIEGYTALQWQRRVSTNLDEDVALQILAAHGVEDQCFKTIKVLDETAVMALVTEGVISDTEVEAMFPPKVNWAFVPSKDKR
jgi:hypothetical protein